MMTRRSLRSRQQRPVFVADHADVLNVGVGDYGLIGNQRRSGGGGRKKGTCSHCERNCYFVHDVLRGDVSRLQGADRCFVPGPGKLSRSR
jgi:hypothetical protein